MEILESWKFPICQVFQAICKNWNLGNFQFFNFSGNFQDSNFSKWLGKIEILESIEKLQYWKFLRFRFFQMAWKKWKIRNFQDSNFSKPFGKIGKLEISKIPIFPNGLENLEYWKFPIFQYYLEISNFPIFKEKNLEYWNIGILEISNFPIFPEEKLEYWNIGILEISKIPIFPNGLKN